MTPARGLQFIPYCQEAAAKQPLQADCGRPAKPQLIAVGAYLASGPNGWRRQLKRFKGQTPYHMSVLCCRRSDLFRGKWVEEAALRHLQAIAPQLPLQQRGYQMQAGRPQLQGAYAASQAMALRPQAHPQAASLPMQTTMGVLALHAQAGSMPMLANTGTALLQTQANSMPTLAIAGNLPLQTSAAGLALQNSAASMPLPQATSLPVQSSAGSLQLQTNAGMLPQANNLPLQTNAGGRAPAPAAGAGAPYSAPSMLAAGGPYSAAPMLAAGGPHSAAPQQQISAPLQQQHATKFPLLPTMSPSNMGTQYRLPQPHNHAGS